MAEPNRLRTGKEKGGMIMAYWDNKFHVDALRGDAHKYWWEIIIRTADYWILSSNMDTNWQRSIIWQR